ncbi:hypothetical protein, partial [Klebsiella pneumoniae]|uniref:hypothetical protein n=1 Tax=Klebsiella pneumoniae TaxID=573 RepID=UPI001D0DFD24
MCLELKDIIDNEKIHPSLNNKISDEWTLTSASNTRNNDTKIAAKTTQSTKEVECYQTIKENTNNNRLY